MGAVVLHLPSVPLKPHCGLQPVPRCEPSSYWPISQWLGHCTIEADCSVVYTSLSRVSLRLIPSVSFNANISVNKKAIKNEQEINPRFGAMTEHLP